MINIKEFYYRDKDLEEELILENETAMNKMMDY